MPSAQKQRIRHIKGFKFFAPLSFKKADGVRGGAPEKGCGAEPRKRGTGRNSGKGMRGGTPEEGVRGGAPEKGYGVEPRKRGTGWNPGRRG